MNNVTNNVLLVVEVDDYHEIEEIPRVIRGIKTDSHEVGSSSDGMYWGVVFSEDNRKTDEEFLILCTEKGFYMNPDNEEWDLWVALCQKHSINVKFEKQDLIDWEIVL